jgi:oligoendopeptidase F
MTPTVARPSSSADGVTWNLADLYKSVDDPRLNQDLATARKRAEAFEATYRGKIDVLGGPPVDFLGAAVRELESLNEQMDRPLIYASLLHAGKTDEPRNGALLSRTREERTAINQHLIFFDLEWIKVADEAVTRLLKAPALARYRHWLEQKRAWKPHYLSEPEEKILEEKSNTGRAAFVRLFDESVAGIGFPYEHNGTSERVTLQQLNAKLYDPDRSVRRDAARGITRGLQENARLLTYVFNTLVQDHRSDCRLRHWDTVEGPRHLANEISAEVVSALMTACERHHALVQRYYRLKGRL